MGERATCQPCESSKYPEASDLAEYSREVRASGGAIGFGYTQPMNVLALDSTTPGGSIALHVDNSEAGLFVGQPELTWSARLPGDILRLLAAHSMRPGDVDVFAVNTGPGSLTGLRVGLSTVQGLAMATGRPVAPVSVFEAVAEDAWSTPSAAFAPMNQNADAEGRAPGKGLLGIWLNAMRGEVFTSVFDITGAGADAWRELEPAAVATPAQAAAAWRQTYGTRLVFVEGDVTDDALTAHLRTGLPQIRMRQRPALATAVARIAGRWAQRGRLVAPHAVQPVYVRQPDAVLARARREQAAEPPAQRDRP